jgi:hypothetical protein
MHWVLEVLDNEETDQEIWREVYFPTCSTVPRFKGYREAFEFFFAGRDRLLRNPNRRYRLAPRFSTQPIEVRREKVKVCRAHGWYIEKEDLVEDR